MTAGDPFFAASHDGPVDTNCGDPFSVITERREREARFSFVYLDKDTSYGWLVSIGVSSGRRRNQFERWAINDNANKVFVILDNRTWARDLFYRLVNGASSTERYYWEKGKILENGDVVHDT